MDLLKKAKQALKNAYAPYSRFRVGAAVLMKSGEVYVGCNVENASFGATICAERNAIHAAVCAGEKEIKEVFLVTETAESVTPCGICRQVISEFASPSTKVTCATVEGKNVRVYTVADLLPHAFEKKSLG